MILFKRKKFFYLEQGRIIKLDFRSLKLLEEKYLEAKKAYDIAKSQLSQAEHRV